MAKIRIYELARELNMTNKQLLEKLEELGIPVKSHMSSVEEPEIDSIKAKIHGKKQPELVEKRIRPSVIRRRKIKAPAKPAPAEVEPAVDQADDKAAGVDAEPVETPEPPEEAEKEAVETAEEAAQPEAVPEEVAAAEATDTADEITAEKTAAEAALPRPPSP